MLDEGCAVGREDGQLQAAGLPEDLPAQLIADLAHVYNQWGNALDNARDAAAALAAYERAVALQPDEAMWRRNVTGVLIDLGRLDEAAAARAAAQALEPEAARLPELAAQLAEALQAAAQRQAGAEGNEP